MAAMKITTGAITATAAGPLTGDLDTSGITRPINLRVDFSAITPGTTARVAIEDTTRVPLIDETTGLQAIDSDGSPLWKPPFSDAQTVFSFTIGQWYLDALTNEWRWKDAAGDDSNPFRENRDTAAYAKLEATAVAGGPVNIFAEAASESIRSGTPETKLRVNVLCISDGCSITVNAYTV